MCSLWKKLEERHSQAGSPENTESPSQIRPVVAVSGSTAMSPVWGGAVQWLRALHCIGSLLKC